MHQWLILTPTPRERKRWHPNRLFAPGGHRCDIGIEPRTVGRWLAAFGKRGPRVLKFEQPGGSPLLVYGYAQQVALRTAVQEPLSTPTMARMELANWNPNVVRWFELECLGFSLRCSSIRAGCQAVCLGRIAIPSLWQPRLSPRGPRRRATTATCALPQPQPYCPVPPFYRL